MVTPLCIKKGLRVSRQTSPGEEKCTKEMEYGMNCIFSLSNLNFILPPLWRAGEVSLPLLFSLRSSPVRRWNQRVGKLALHT